ncbi:MAG TPA: hypothetical protein VLG28_11795 [Acidimicrobiia bacterium]|jgi:hypothetical protein|nr:hypothetical protein [Acidimicrobiia bacterium]
MRRFLIGTGFLGHAALHLGFIAPPSEDGDSPFTIDTSWLLPAGTEWVVGLSLATIAIVAFVGLTGAAWGLRQLRFAWRPLLGIGATASLGLLVAFWNPWLILGVAINVGLLIVTFATPDWWDHLLARSASFSPQTRWRG